MIRKFESTDGNVIACNPEKVKIVENEKYVIIFDPRTGNEVLFGTNGYPEDPFALEYPSMLDIGIMGHCDNKCSFCYQGDKWEPNMPLERFMMIVDQSKDFVNQCALGGRGDPNQHEDFEKILSYARKNGIVPNYTSSGINLTQEQINISKRYCGAVAISMYKKEHTWKALKDLMDAVVKTNIHYVVTKHNMNDVLDLVNGIDVFDGKVDLERLNAIVFLLFKPQGRGKNLDWSPSMDELKIFAEYIKKPKAKFKIGMDSCLINKIADVRELTKLEEAFADTCEGARMSCYITPDGRLVPCSFGDHDKYGVDINKTPIKDAWLFSKGFFDFREVLTDKKNCCPFTVKGW